MQKFQLLCVNLERSADRRAAIRAQADALGLAVEFVPAVDGRAMAPDDPELRRYDAARRRWTWRSDLTGAEVACVLSHRRALERFLNSDAEFSVVLEDDALLSDSFAARVEAVLAARAQWSIVRLETRLNEQESPVIADLGAAGALVLRRKWTLGAAAVLYSRAGAKAVLRGTETFYEAFDNVIGRPFAVGDVILELEPPAAREDTGAPSTIEAQRAGAARNKGARRLWRWAMSLYRLWARLQRLRR